MLYQHPLTQVSNQKSCIFGLFTIQLNPYIGYHPEKYQFLYYFHISNFFVGTSQFDIALFSSNVPVLMCDFTQPPQTAQKWHNYFKLSSAAINYKLSSSLLFALPQKTSSLLLFSKDLRFHLLILFPRWKIKRKNPNKIKVKSLHPFKPLQNQE